MVSGGQHHPHHKDPLTADESCTPLVTASGQLGIANNFVQGGIDWNQATKLRQVRHKMD